MSLSRCTFGIFLLLSALTLAGAGWAQTTKPASPGHAILYGRAVSLLDQAQQQLNTGNISAAKAQAKEANSLFTLLKNEYASKLAEHELSPQEDQQLAINQKLAADTQTQADRLMETAAAQDKRGQELETQGREEASSSLMDHLIPNPPNPSHEGGCNKGRLISDPRFSWPPPCQGCYKTLGS